MIYRLVLDCFEARTIICCWKNIAQLPFTSAIIRHDNRASAKRVRIQNGLFQVSRQVSEEARLMFYRKHTFRFNSNQFAVLLTMPRVWGHLQSIEIEDTSPQQRMWNVEDMLDRLSRLHHMKSIVLGSKVLGRSSWLAHPFDSQRYKKFLKNGTQDQLQAQGERIGDKEFGRKYESLEGDWHVLAAIRKWTDEGYGVSSQDWDNFKEDNCDPATSASWRLHIPLLPNTTIIDFRRRWVREGRSVSPGTSVTR